MYDSDADAFEATADRVVAVLCATPGSTRIAVALSGGRGGRGVMIALSARPDLPWNRIDWYFVDDRCVPADHQHSNIRLARENLLAPRRVPATQIVAPPTDGDPTAIATAYAATLRAKLGGDPPVFDLILLGVGPDGHIASLAPGCAALRAITPVAVVAPDEMRTEPAVARITLTPPVLAAARHVIVTACGKEKAAAVAAALTAPNDPAQRPSQLVPPSERVTWILDLASADTLIHAAVPAPQ